jgi:outer membrane protein TolC
MEWSARIVKQQPAQQQVQAWQQLQEGSQRAGSGLVNNATASLAHENDSPTGSEGVQNWEAEISFPLKALSQKEYFGPLADAYAQLAKRHQALLHWQARGIARTLLDQLEVAWVRLRHAQASVAQTQRLYQLVVEKVAAGGASRLDEVLAKQQLNTAQAQLANARGSVQTQLGQLAQWGIQIKESDLEALFKHPSKAPVIADLGQRVAQHPRVRFVEAKQALQQAQTRLEAWSAQAGTEVSLGVISEKDNTLSRNNSLRLQVSIPLGQPAEARLAKSQARTVPLTAKATIEQARLETRLELVKAQARLNQAKQALAPMEAALAAAQDALHLSEQAWQQGELSLRNLILAQQDALNARLQADMAHYALHAATRNLNQAAGE